MRLARMRSSSGSSNPRPHGSSHALTCETSEPGKINRPPETVIRCDRVDAACAVRWIGDSPRARGQSPIHRSGAVDQAFVPGLPRASVSAFPLARGRPGTNALTDRPPDRRPPYQHRGCSERRRKKRAGVSAGPLRLLAHVLQQAARGKRPELTCPCRPCHPCRPCRACRRACGRRPWATRPPSLPS